MFRPFKKSRGGGNQFAFDGDKSQLNLSTANFGALGEYIVAVVSDDQAECVVDSICVTGFVIE